MKQFQIIKIGNHTITAQFFQFDQLICEKTYFDHQQFTEYLEQVNGAPCYILLDIIEEDFKIEKLPKVSFFDRRQLINRKVKSLFRNTPYVHWQKINQSDENKKSETILASGIINPDLLTFWFLLLIQYNVPIVGIYSASLLIQNLVKKLPFEQDLLLISFEQGSGIRQSYISNGFIRFSRLTPQLDWDGRVNAQVEKELEKTLKYLLRLKLADQNRPYDVVMICHDEFRLGEYWHGKIHYMRPDSLGKKLGIKCSDGLFCDELFSQSIIKFRPNTHYRSNNALHLKTKITKYCKYSMVALSVFFIFLSGFFWITSLDYQKRDIQAKQITNIIKEQYFQIKKTVPKSPFSDIQARGIVDLYEHINRLPKQPEFVLEKIAREFVNYEKLKIDNIHWYTDPNKALGTHLASKLTNQFNKKGYNHYQIVVMKGEIYPYDENHRENIFLLQQLAKKLRTIENVLDSDLLQTPIALKSDQQIIEDDNKRQRRALFSLYVMVGEKNERSKKT